MTEVKVKSHTRKSKTGKIELVQRHLREVSKKKLRKEDVPEVKNKPILSGDKKEVVSVRIKRGIEKKVVRKKVIDSPDSPEFIKSKYEEKYPVTWKIMKQGKWKDVGNRKIIVLNEKDWKKLLKEHLPLINSLARKYSFGQSFGERYNEVRAIALAGFAEGVSAYGKHFNSKEPPDFARVVFAYSHGRIKEDLANRLNSGVRIPAFLQKPYRQYLEVKRKLVEGNKVTTIDQISNELDKIWNKNTFYVDYALAQERKYKKEDKLKGGEKIIRDVGFSELTKKEKDIELEKDKLPMDGYVTIKKIGVAKSKEEKHKENLIKIEEKYKLEFDKLGDDYLLNQTMPEKDKKIGRKIIDSKVKKVDEVESKKKNENSMKLNKLLEIETKEQYIEDETKKINIDIEFLGKKEKLNRNEKTKLTKLKNRKEKLNKEKLLLGSQDYINKNLEVFNKKIKQFENDLIDAKKDLFIAQEFYKEIDEVEYSRRKNDIERRKGLMVIGETHRYNKDSSSTYIPGIKERIKEFEQLESMKSVPLNLSIDSDDGDSTQMYELVLRPNELKQDDLIELIETHTMAKNIIRDNINKLVPVYRDIFGLYIGLHDDSKATADNLWGQLKTQKEIADYLNDKHKIILNNPDKFVDMLSKSNINNRHLILGSIPFILSKYRRKPEILMGDFKAWKSKKPGDRRKIKIDEKQYKKLEINWKVNKIKAKKEFDDWRKKKKYKFSQTESSKKLLELKNKYNAKLSDQPKKFIFVKGVDLKKLKIWKTKMPNVFALSQSRREIYVRSVISDSIEIIRRLTPIKQVRDLLSAHRRLVENGISLEKAINGDNVSLYMESYWNLIKVVKMFGMREVQISTDISFNKDIEKANTLYRNNEDNTRTIIWSNNIVLENLRIMK